jgi:serine/threonine-protein kinase
VRDLRRPTLALVLATMCALATPPAAAQAPAAGGDREAQRTELYKDAVDLANAGKWAEAAEKLQAVLAIRSSPKVRFTFGQAEEHIGKLATAYDAYAQALADAEAAGEPDVADTAGRAMRALGPRVPVVRVKVTGAGASAATATIDEHATKLGDPVRVDPGEHVVEVTAPGAKAARSKVTVAEGQRVEVPVELAAEEFHTAPGANPTPAAAEGEPAPEPTAPSGPFPWRTVGLVAAGVGIVGMGVGTYFGIDAISKNNTSNQTGCSSNVCTQGAYDTREDAKSAATASTIAFVVGGVLAAGGITLWLLGPKGDTAAQVTPVALAGGGGLTLTGAWR